MTSFLSTFAENYRKYAVEYQSFKSTENLFNLLLQIKAKRFKYTIKHALLSI